MAHIEEKITQMTEHVGRNEIWGRGSPSLAFLGQRSERKIATTLTEENFEEYDRYNMNHAERGVALIFNNIIFEDSFQHERHGAELDEVKLSDTLRKIGFDVRLHRDLGWSQIRERLSEVAAEDHKDRDCLLVAIMTHGEEKGRLRSRDQFYQAENVWDMFKPEKAPSLVGKPKIFLFQACRGTMFEDNALLIDSTDAAGLNSSLGRIIILPANADFLIAFSSLKGYLSFRNSRTGTWFIQDFCKELEENVYKKDFLSILTRTLRRVSYLRSALIGDSDLDGRHQMPVFSSTLTRDIFFYHKSLSSEKATPSVTICSEAGIDEIDRQAVSLNKQPQIESPAELRPIQFLEDELLDFERYKMDHPRRGVALVFNHRTYQSSLVEERECAARDGEVILDTLKNFRFNVRTYNDNSLDQIKKVLSDVAKEDHSDCDCFLVVIMTHGEENGVLHSWDDTYKTKEVWDRFTPEKVPSLEGKPKLFLFQACRGNKSQISTEIIDSIDFPSAGKSIVPSHADFLVAYSCVEGHYSFKNREGSWFIQDFCTELNRNSNRKDILAILTDTFRRVVLTRRSNVPFKIAVHEKQQIPAFNSTLTKRLFL